MKNFVTIFIIYRIPKNLLNEGVLKSSWANLHFVTEVGNIVKYASFFNFQESVELS